MAHMHIFLDEFGNEELHADQPERFSHLILTAVALEEAQASQAREICKNLLEKHGQHRFADLQQPASEIDLAQTLHVLKELRSLNVVVLALVINKSKLKGAGLSQPDIFYKFFNRLFLKQFPKNYTSFSIYAHQLGWPEFRQRLQQFIDTKVIQRDLFAPERSFRMVADKEAEPLTALAPFFARCLGLIYCTSHSHPGSGALFDLLHDRTFVSFFPFEQTDYHIALTARDESQNRAIATIAAESAREALSARSKLSPEAQAVLSYLYLMFRSAPDRLIEKYEIIEKVRKIHPAFSEQQLRLCIQQLRDTGVLIASIQGKSGYKLPDRVEDIAGFYNRYLNSIVPMINRINICNRRLMLNPVGEVDLLQASAGYSLLQELIKTLDKSRQAAPLTAPVAGQP